VLAFWYFFIKRNKKRIYSICWTWI